MQWNSKKVEDFATYSVFFIILLVAYFTSFYSFLLFHTISELFSIIIAGGIFVVGWNSRKLSDNSFIFILGITSLFYSIMDLLHTLSYDGMQIFIGITPNIPTQLWIAARYTQAISILIAFFSRNKKMRPSVLIVSYIIAVSVLIDLIFVGWFPVCWDGGLTPFKIISEYVIVLLLSSSMVILIKIRRDFNKTIFIFLLLSFISTIISELAFTFYASVYGFSNLVGHLFKILSFFCMYKAVIQINLENPLNSLFRKLKRNEQSLEERARDLQVAYSESDQIFNSSIPMRAIDKDCTIVKVNESYLAYFKETRGDILNEKCYDLSPGVHCFKDSCSFNKIRAGSKSYEYEVEFFNQDNTKLYYIIHSVPWYSPEGEIQGLIQTFIDITTRKLTEEKLVQSEEKYRKLFDFSPIGIGITTPEGQVLALNRTMSEITGYSLEELNRVGLVNTYENLEERKKFIALLEKYGKVNDFVTKLRKKDGSTYYGLLNAEFLTIDDHKAIITNLRDITEEREIQEVIQNLAKFPSENPNPVLRVNESDILYINNSGRALFNVEEGDDLIEIFKDPVIKAMKIAIPMEFETIVLNRIFSFKITPILNKGYVNIYGEDITTRREAEKKVEQFISIASHELLTPITVLTQSVELENKYGDKLSEEQRKNIHKSISQNVYLLSDLAKDLLTISRIDERRIIIEMQEYQPFYTIQDILRTMELRKNLKKLTIKLDVDEDIILNGDVQRISRIFRVLIDNALKYSNEHGNVTIKAVDRYTRQINGKNVDGVLFQVIDDGIGIREDDMPKLFQRFFRSELVSHIPGTGLGLTIAQELAKLHGGEIQAESKLGEGSTFALFLPRN